MVFTRKDGIFMGYVRFREGMLCSSYSNQWLFFVTARILCRCFASKGIVIYPRKKPSATKSHDWKLWHSSVKFGAKKLSRKKRWGFTLFPEVFEVLLGCNAQQYALKELRWRLNSWSQRLRRMVFPLMQCELCVYAAVFLTTATFFLNAPHRVRFRPVHLWCRTERPSVRKASICRRLCSTWSWEGTLIHLCNMWNFHNSWFHGLRGRCSVFVKYDAAHRYQYVLWLINFCWSLGDG